MAGDALVPVIEARDLHKSYRMGEAVVPVLRGADLTVRAGEFVAIEGKSGSGKSTLLHLMGLLDEPDQGQVSVGGVDARTLSGGRRATVRNRQIGFVFQFYHLLPELDVLGNTMLAAMVGRSWLAFRRQKSELRDKAAALLDTLGMSHRATHRPAQLSGGERQRVAIARALMNDPPILLADEPTGNLDAETGTAIMDALAGVHAEGRALVMVTHDRSLATTADRSYVMREGKLQAG
jgi:lipoprotein-releasing system ATP-binding protein